MTRLSTGNIHGLYVRNSQSIVMSDYYVESADHLLDLRGDPGDTPGRITICMAKTHCLKNPVIEIGDYQGQISLGPSMFYPGMINPAEIVHRVAGPLKFILMSTMAYDIQLHFDLGAGTERIFVGNDGKSPPDEIPAGASDNVADAFDDLRKLGALDLKLNYPGIKGQPH